MVAVIHAQVKGFADFITGYRGCGEGPKRHMRGNKEDLHVRELKYTGTTVSGRRRGSGRNDPGQEQNEEGSAGWLRTEVRTPLLTAQLFNPQF
jgi:hypothetical protein